MHIVSTRCLICLSFAFFTQTLARPGNAVLAAAANPSATAIPSACQTYSGGVPVSCWDALDTQDFLTQFTQSCSPSKKNTGAACACPVKGVGWANCFLNIAEWNVCNGPCKNASNLQPLVFSCTDLGGSSILCGAPPYPTPLDSESGRFLVAAAGIVSFYRYARVWYQVIQASSILDGIQSFIATTRKYRPEYLEDVHYALGAFLKYYAINGTNDMAFGNSIIAERQSAKSPLTPASNVSSILQAQLAVTLNQSVASILSNWTDPRFFELSRSGQWIQDSEYVASDRRARIFGNFSD